MRLLPALKPKDAAALAFLLIAGFVYYGQYYDCGFNTGDEGSLLLLTMRVMEGERPYLDVGLGYGLLWYYPLVLLFKITGVSFIAARIFFLSLAVASSVLAYLTVRKHTVVMAPAIAVGLLVLAFPGNLQSVYIPFVILANMLAVSCIDLDRPSLEPGRLFAAAVVVAVTWHVRADIGFCAALVLIGTLIGHALSHPPRSWPSHLVRLGAGLGAAALLPTLPLVLVAHRQGFLGAFLTYSGWPLQYLSRIPRLFRTGALVEVAADAPAQAGTTLARVPAAAVLEGGPLQSFGLLTYLPLVTLPLMALLACFLMLRKREQGQAVVGNDTLGVLALVGLAVSSFPQFFLFRPDFAHLSFFMPGYFVLAAVGIGRWVLPPPDRAREPPRETPSKPGFTLPLRLAFGSLLAAHIGFYLLPAVNVPSTGSMIALSRGRTDRYIGKNGVDVAVSPVERYVFNLVSQVVEDHTDEDDVLLSFPFGPGWNVMTNRRSSMYTLYVDDSMLGTGIQERIIGQIEREQPPVIIVDNWPVNGTEISRFKNWATRVMDHMAAEYVVAESFGSLELYVLERPAEPPGADELRVRPEKPPRERVPAGQAAEGRS